jgi:phosphoribosyl-ATP pyrophosphohydrolase/phosphoribosyl-AMP cyclohydrolase
VVDVRLDCDGDAILLLIHQTGPACHTNELSCFFQVLSEDESGEGAVAPPPSGGIVHRLFRVLHQRKGASPESSYTASLFHKGMPAILAKVAEEAQETQDALRDESDERVVNETADLLYHVLVGLAARDIDVDAVAQVLAQRMGTSGLAEKAKRG